MLAIRVTPSLPRTETRKLVLLVRLNTIVPFVLNDGGVVGAVLIILPLLFTTSAFAVVGSRLMAGVAGLPTVTMPEELIFKYGEPPEFDT